MRNYLKFLIASTRFWQDSGETSVASEPGRARADFSGFKKIICTALVAGGLLAPSLALPASVSAVNVFQVCTGTAAKTDVCKEAKANSKGNPIVDLLKVVLDILSIIVGVAAVIMIIIAGIKFTTSGGDPSGIKSARDTVVYSLIGVAVAISSQAIVVFVLNKLK